MRKPADTLTAAALATRLYGLLPPNSRRVLVAYSGGRDSHVLLHALSAARTVLECKLVAVHVNHGLHSEAADWAAHCQQVCDTLEVPLTVLPVEVMVNGNGLEAAAREARYHALAQLMRAGDCVVTAHHRDDQVETQLLHLLRGTGVAGLGAMKPSSPLAPGYVVRPLLDWPRSALEAYAAEAQLHWINDSSNDDTHLNRNFLRHKVLPLLRQRWPALDQVVARNAAHWQDGADLLRQLAEQDRRQCADADTLRINSLMLLSPPRRRCLLRYWLQLQNATVPTTRHLAELERLVLQRPRSGQGCVRWSGCEVWRHKERLWLRSTSEILDPGVLVWRDPRQPLPIQGTGYQLSAQAVQDAGLSRAAIAGRVLTVRLRQGGERCLLPGRDHHSKVKKLLQDASMPPWERARLPLVYAGNELAAIADRWVCAPFAADSGEPGWKLHWQPATEN